MPVYKSSEFPGMGFSYDPATQPFFKALCKESLRKLKKESQTARDLFKAIERARPATRDNSYPKGVNVVLQPPLARQFSAPGLVSNAGVISVGDQAKFDGWYTGKNGRLQPSMSAKVQAQPTADAGSKYNTDGTPGCGCTACVFYSNYEILAKNGAWLPPEVTMAHELIHCYHFMTGKAQRDYRAEEHQTVGIKGYHANDFTENKIRYDLGYRPRTTYFADD
jgi:hypothetical protein